MKNFYTHGELIYEWLYKKDIFEGKPFKKYASLYEAFAEQLSPDDYVEFRKLSEEEVTKMYGSPWKPRDEIASNEDQMEMYLSTDMVNSKEFIREEGRYFDHVSGKWMNVESSLEIFRQLYLGHQN